ncbi:MAG: hypothetical protein LBI94_04700, partial [Treponema sp.]|nr:hypothetical protein [Treponema sp.]
EVSAGDKTACLPAPEDPWSSAPSPLLVLAQEVRLLDLNTITPLETINRVKLWQELLAGIPGIAETLPFKKSRKEKTPARQEGPGLFDSN